MGQYMTGEVCLNGHPTTGSAERHPEMTGPHCPKCGEKTIRICQKCNTNIRGEFYVEGVFSLREYIPPAYCYSCGAAFPWTATALEAARELTDELEELSVQDKEQLKGSIGDLVTGSPKAQVAATRYKKIMIHAGAEAGSAMKSILVNIVSEAIRKSLFGPDA